MKSCLIFDMDGLLFDTERPIMLQLQRACAERGVTLSHEEYRQCIGQSFEQTAQFFTEHYGIADAKEMLNTVERGMYTQKIVPLKSGAREILVAGRSAQLTMAIGTSSVRQIALNYTRGQQIDGYFSTIVGRDQVAQSKPNPDIYQEVLKQLNMRPDQAVVLEDSYHGVLAASRADIRAVHIPDLFPTEPKIARLCYATYPSLHAVIDDLDRLLS